MLCVLMSCCVVCVDELLCCCVDEMLCCVC